MFAGERAAAGTVAINGRCLVRTQDGHRVVLVAGIVLCQYAVGDRMAEAHAMVSLVEQGWAEQCDVARAFSRSARTVRRFQRRFEAGGLPALARASGYPSGRPRLNKIVALMQGGGVMGSRDVGHPRRGVPLMQGYVHRECGGATTTSRRRSGA